MKILLIILMLSFPVVANAEDKIIKVIKEIETKGLSNITKISNLSAIEDGKATYDNITKKVTLTLNESPNKKCWRLVWDRNKNVIGFFESSGITRTYHDLYCGTKEECLNTIKNINLIIGEEI